MLSSDNFSIVSEARNVQLSLLLKNHMLTSFLKLNIDIHSWSDKAVKGIEYRRESDMPLFTPGLCATTMNF